MKTHFALLLAVLAGACLLVACASAPAASQADQIATAVAATLQEQVAPTDTTGPIDGEIQPQVQYGECANSGQVSVAYVKDGNVWLWVQGAGASQLTADGAADTVRISDDGCQVAYAHSVVNPAFDASAEAMQVESTRELRVVSSDGSRDVLLAGADYFATLPAPPEGALYSMSRFAWQPGAYNLAFGTRLAYPGPGLSTTDEIALVDIDSGAITPLLAAGEGGDIYFSHDGQQIAFSDSTSISAINVDGSNLRRDLITFPLVLTYSEYLYYPPVYWDPADAALIAAIPPEEGLPVEGAPTPETGLWYMPLDGTLAWEAGSIQSIWFAVQQVAFSPDISRIAYLRPVGEPADNQRELVIALSNGSNESLQLNQAQIEFESWAPDSERFMYSYNDGELHLVASNADGSIVAPQALPDGFAAGAVEVSWIAPEQYLLFAIGGPGAELRLATIDGASELIAAFGQPFASYDIAD